MQTTALVARWRLRRSWWATVGLLVLAGVAAAAPLALWAAARQTATAVPRFIESAEVADATLLACPPGYDPDVEGDPGPCLDYQAEAGVDAMGDLPGVDEASSLQFVPLDVEVLGSSAPPRSLGVSALRDEASRATVLGDPLVTDGRLFRAGAPDEVVAIEALADELGVSVGDQVLVRSPVAPDGRRVPLTVVGIVQTPAELLPLGLESLAGPAFYGRSSVLEVGLGEDFPSFTAPVVWLDDSDVGGLVEQLEARFEDQSFQSEPIVSPADLESLQHAFPLAVTPFPVPASVANADRIVGLPVLLAIGGALLAAVTLTHALVVSARRNRRELSVLRVLGFTAGQVRTALATQASLLGIVAVVPGVVLGVIGARWGWRTIAESFGLVSGPLVPVWVVVAGAAAALVVANLAAAAPGRLSGRLTPAEALRDE